MTAADQIALCDEIAPALGLMKDAEAGIYCSRLDDFTVSQILSHTSPFFGVMVKRLIDNDCCLGIAYGEYQWDNLEAELNAKMASHADLCTATALAFRELLRGE